MESWRDVKEDDVIAATESALARTSGLAVNLSCLETISGDRRRHLIIRATATFSDGSAERIIIKVTRSKDYDPRADNALQKSGLLREWTSTALLKPWADTGMRVSQFLGGDVDLGLMITRDLGADVTSLVGPLMGDKPSEAHEAILAYARALGDLHARTAGCEDSYNDIARATFPHDSAKTDHLAALTRSMDTVQHALGGTFNKAELVAIAAKLNRSGPWQTLVHGDLCPDNVLFRGGHAFLIDFESGQPGHALLDATYLRMGFPTCWCAGRLPMDVAKDAETAYLNAFRMSDDIDDAGYRLELAHICAAHMLKRTAGLLEEAIVADQDWGIASVRERILWWLTSSSLAMEDAKVLPGLQALVNNWIDDLKCRWVSSTMLGYYPAFEAASLKDASPRD
ncbi:MAG: phosphotransferase [Pseudomonadota bacterium]